MWVMSQDGETLINLSQTKELSVVIDVVPSTKIVDGKEITKPLRGYVYADDIQLGQYRSQKHARHILNYLKHEITSHGYSDSHVCQMPKGEEDADCRCIKQT